VKSAISAAPKLSVGQNIVASTVLSTKTTQVFFIKSIMSLAASMAVLPISAIWHMPVSFAIAERVVISLQSTRPEKLFDCSVLAVTGGQNISGLMALLSNH
jgi:hypothetical protein